MTNSTGPGAAAGQERKVCIVVASPMTAEAFLRDQLIHLGNEYDLTVVANSPDDGFLKRIGARADFIPVLISRRVDLRRDLAALSALYKIFRKRKFDLVHSVTPKAGLLSMIAAVLSGVSIRIHTFTGQVWVTRRGIVRFIFKVTDRLLALCATHVLVDSSSQREFLVRNRVVGRKKTSVLGSGSISGVDLARFRPDAEVRNSLRTQLQIPDEAVVFLYVGRLNRDKGIPELLSGFEMVLARVPNAWLLIVGPDEEALGNEIEKSPASRHIKQVGYTDEPERYMAGADVFVLPSHREGFGSTVIEAAATGIPSIASRIYGLTDAVLDGKTGLLVEAKDVNALARAMKHLALNEEQRLRMGLAARERATQEFSMEIVTAYTLNYYRGLLEGSGENQAL